MQKKLSYEEIIDLGKKVVIKQSQAIAELESTIDQTFVQLVQELSCLKGKLIISGMGKSGNIARKIASTLSSTGTSSFYLHPAEAKHGDLGVIKIDDIVMLLSNSGETDELNSIIHYCKRFGVRMISMTRNSLSTLASVADINVVLPSVPEASMLGAPTTSSTMMIVYGDALAIALHHNRNFSEEDYKILHPGGQIGAKLRYVNECMHTGAALPLVSEDSSMAEAIVEISEKRLGCVGVTNEGKLVGVITDGDLRRNMHKDMRVEKAGSIMHNMPMVISGNTMAAQALNIMNNRSITNLFVVDDGIPVGLVHIHDLLKLGVV